MNLKIKNFERINLLSNRNLEKLASSVINKSYNAVLVNMYEDSVIMLDHNEGYFYKADYTFNENTLTFVFENFDRIILEKEESNFNKNVYDYFDGDADIASLTESYKNNISDQDKIVSEIIGESVNNKNFEEVLDITEIYENKEEIDYKNEVFFRKWKDRLISHPMNEVLNFNWEDKVAVTLTESESVKIVSKDVEEKARNLWKNEKFKGLIKESFSTLLEDTEAGIEQFKELLEHYPIIFTLSKADRKTLFGKAIVSDKLLRESVGDLTKGIEIIFESNEDVMSMKKSYLEEACKTKKPKFVSNTDKKTPVDGGPEGQETEETDEPEELTPDENKKISDSLQKIADKVSDEKLKEKLQKIIDDLSDSEETGMKVESVKEAIAILSL